MFLEKFAMEKLKLFIPYPYLQLHRTSSLSVSKDNRRNTSFLNVDLLFLDALLTYFAFLILHVIVQKDKVFLFNYRSFFRSLTLLPSIILTGFDICVKFCNAFDRFMTHPTCMTRFIA